MKLKPLKEWYCDKCGEIVTEEEGYIEWFSESAAKGRPQASEFKIVHNKSQCKIHSDKLQNTLPITSFLGPDGLVRLFSFLDIGPIVDKENSGSKIKNMREFVELMRRLHIPHYEEARFNLENAFNDGSLGTPSEIYIYSQEALKYIITDYESL